MNNQLISVVMSVYNGGGFLPGSIESILSQTYKDFEFIIINDGSTDGTSDILKDYAGKDKRVKVIEQENSGLTQALIRGCNAAEGEYIARQDCADISLPERIMLQKEALDQDNELAFVSCWTQYCGPEWEFLYLQKGANKAALPIYIISKENNAVIDGPTCHSSVMFRKDAYLKAGGYREEFYFAQDWDLWLRLAGVGKFQALPKTLYKFRLMPGSLSVCNRRSQEILRGLITASIQKKARGLSDADILKKAQSVRPEKQKPLSSSRWQEAACLYFIGENLRKNRDSQASKYFKRSLQACPFYFRTWIRILQMYVRAKARYPCL